MLPLQGAREEGGGGAASPQAWEPGLCTQELDRAVSVRPGGWGLSGGKEEAG